VSLLRQWTCRWSRTLAAAVCTSALLLTSCASDPTTGFAFGGGYRTDVRTVAVPIWENRTFTPELGAQLTEAIIKEIQRSTPWVVTSSAQTRLTGVITASDLRRLGTDPTSGLVQDMAVDLAVDFQWQDISKHKPILVRKHFRASGSFVPTQGINEPIEIGRQGAIENLARDIVTELRSGW
jgi:Lipopolysaccharide-assembly